MASPGTRRLEPVTFGSPHFESVEIGGLLVTDATFPPGGRLCPHVHDRTCIATTLQGSFASRMRGRSHWSRPGMVVIEPAGERHDNVFGEDGARILIVQPDRGRQELLRPFAGFLDSINHFADTRIALLAHRLSMEVVRPDEVTPLAIEAVGLELLAVAARRFLSRERRRPAPPWLIRVRERLHDGFADSVTLAELAEIAGVHPGHLTRMFRRHYGQSIGEYMREARLEWTARQLAASGDPLVAIAAAAGFSDQSHFTRAFRRRFGCAPGEYRSRVRGDARYFST